MVTMTQARKAFAGRTMVRPAEFDEKGQRSRKRVNLRANRGGMSLRHWARYEYGDRAAHELAPKLARIALRGSR